MLASASDKPLMMFCGSGVDGVLMSLKWSGKAHVSMGYRGTDY